MSRTKRFAAAGVLALAVGGVLAATTAPAQAAQIRPGSAEDCVMVLAYSGYSAATGYDEGALTNACEVAVETQEFQPFEDAMTLLGVDFPTIRKAFIASQWW